jgi:hypothetical protein
VIAVHLSMHLSDRPAQRVEKILAEALDLSSAARRAYLDAACAGDPLLRKEIDSLLAASDQAGAFMSPPGEQVWSTQAKFSAS